MAKISLNKRIEATKLHERTGAPLAGPEVTIPFGALVESVGTERDRERFRYLGALYSAPQEIFLEATRPDEAGAAPALGPAPVEPKCSAAPGAKEASLRFEQLNAGGYAVARAKVPGGWLVTCGAGVTFYPDQGHEWDGASVE